MKEKQLSSYFRELTTPPTRYLALLRINSLFEMRTNSGGLVPPTAFLCNDNVSTLDALPRFAFAFE